MVENGTVSGEPLVHGWSVARRSDLLWRRTATEVLVLEPATRQLVVLEGAGVHLWDRLATRRDVSQVISSVAAHSGTDSAGVAREVLGALRDLESRGLLEANPR